MNYRAMTSQDVPAIFDVVFRTREKSYERAALTAVNITEESTVEKMDVIDSHEGWVCECDGKIVGFVMGDRKTGEIWVLAMLPEYERRGIGSKLYTLVVEWLISEGWKEGWLAVLPEIQVVGHAFFKKRGWVDDEMRAPFQIMKKALVDADPKA